MPRILEMKVIDGELWCKVPLENQNSPVHLYTADEMKSHDFGTRLTILSEIEEWAKERRKSAY